MSFITWFLLGNLIGAVGIGLPTLRTLSVIKGEFVIVFFYSILASMSMLSFTMLVANGNIGFMIGNTLGSALSVTWIAYNEKRKLWKLSSGASSSL